MLVAFNEIVSIINFSFATHLTTEKDEQIVLELLTDIVTTTGDQQLKSFDLFVVSTNGTFKTPL